MSYSYHSEQWLPQPVEVIFAFFAAQDNLPKLMPAWQKARIEEATVIPPPRSAASSSSVEAAGAGSRLTLSFRPFPYLPFRVRWVAEITNFVWNDSFRDRQVSGPFAYWDHTHRLRALDREGLNVTLVVDDVEYEMPFGPLGRLAHSLFLRSQIERTFAFRQCQIAQIFAEIRPEAPLPERQIQPKSIRRPDARAG
jgi:ligand-binding SRPBCC domain-containing protein